MSDARIDSRARVSATATLGAGCVVGPEAIVGDLAVLQAGCRVGAGALVEPRAAVSGNVPARALVAGVPAKVTGFRGHDGAHLVPRRVDASAPRSDWPALAVPGAVLHALPLLTDARGALTFGQVGTHLPFEPKRFFAITSVPTGEVRGEHAHRELHQFLVCLSGTCHVMVDDGQRCDEVILDSPRIGLHLRPMVWGVQYCYSPGAVLLVLASDVYKESDYLRDYDQFVAAVGR